MPRRQLTRYRSLQHWLDLFRTYYGPVHKTFEALSAPKREALTDAIHLLIEEYNVARDGSMVVPSEYLEIIVTKK